MILKNDKKRKSSINLIPQGVSLLTWFIPPYLVAILITVCVATRLTIDSAPLLPPPYNLAGLFFILAGVALLLMAARRFKAVRTNIHTFRDPNRLVTTGPFAVTRNPMYLGFLIVLTGVAIVCNTALGFVVVPIFFIAANWWYIPFEEARAAEQFGSDYQAYRERVRRWI